jgi:hypothetical protein
MPNYAVVNADNVVENIIVWDEVSAWEPPEGRFIVKSEEIPCSIGWHHKDGVFTAPPEPEPPAPEITEPTT